jgi:hypothetical protein
MSPTTPSSMAAPRRGARASWRVRGPARGNLNAEDPGSSDPLFLSRLNCPRCGQHRGILVAREFRRHRGHDRPPSVKPSYTSGVHCVVSKRVAVVALWGIIGGGAKNPSPKYYRPRCPVVRRGPHTCARHFWYGSLSRVCARYRNK